MTLNNANLQFAETKLTWKSYTIAKALPTTKRVEFINKKEFAKATLDVESKMFVVHVIELEAPEMTIHPLQTAQITSGNPVQIAALKQNEAPTKVLVEYLDFIDVFLVEESLVLLQHTKLNKHIIKLEDDKQPPYRLIYSLKPVKLETLKTYIKTHLKTGYI